LRCLIAPAMCAALFAACAVTQPTRDPAPLLPPPQVKASDADRLLKYYHRVLSLKGGELAREYERARQAFEREGSDVNRIQLAMLLSLPSAGFRDDSAAIGLLQPVLKEQRGEESSLRPLALLMQSYILEVRRAEDALQTQTSKLRDEQRRGEALQQKLEALLEMEMKMIEREQSAQPKPR
jgi:hypothetical protein